MPRLGHLTFAAILSLAVNAAGLLLLLRINEYVAPPKARSSRQVTEMHVEIERKKKRPKRRPRQRRRAVSKRPPLPVPSLPSAIQAASLLRPDLDQTSLVRPLLDQELGQEATRLVMSEENVDEPPRILRRVPPEYPSRAADRGIEGHVVLRILVNRTGRVDRVRVEEAQPPGVFETLARKAVMQWRFAPAIFRGKKVAVWCRNRLLFRLSEE